MSFILPTFFLADLSSHFDRISKFQELCSIGFLSPLSCDRIQNNEWDQYRLEIESSWTSRDFYIPSKSEMELYQAGNIFDTVILIEFSWLKDEPSKQLELWKAVFDDKLTWIKEDFDLKRLIRDGIFSYLDEFTTFRQRESKYFELVQKMAVQGFFNCLNSSDCGNIQIPPNIIFTGGENSIKLAALQQVLLLPQSADVPVHPLTPIQNESILGHGETSVVYKRSVKDGFIAVKYLKILIPRGYLQYTIKLADESSKLPGSRPLARPWVVEYLGLDDHSSSLSLLSTGGQGDLLMMPGLILEYIEPVQSMKSIPANCIKSQAMLAARDFILSDIYHMDFLPKNVLFNAKNSVQVKLGNFNDITVTRFPGKPWTKRSSISTVDEITCPEMKVIDLDAFVDVNFYLKSIGAGFESPQCHFLNTAKTAFFSRTETEFSTRIVKIIEEMFSCTSMVNIESHK
jgi:hypothetical protein